MRQKGVLWGLILLPVWGLAGGLLLLVSLGPFFECKRGVKALGKHLLPLLIFLLLLGLPLLTSPNPVGHVLGFLSRYLLPVLLVRALGHYVQQEGSSESLSKALLGGGLALAVVGFVSLLLPRPFHWQGLCLPQSVATQACLLDFSLLPLFQAQGFAMNPNIFGGLLVLVLPFAWASFEPKHPRSRQRMIFTLLTLFVLGTAILLSGSRNAWLAMGCGSIFFLFRRGFSSWRDERRPIKAVAVLLLMGVLGAFVLSHRYSDTGRWIIWKVGFEILQQFPWTGVGILSVEPMYQRMHVGWPQAAHLHNAWLQTMVESGVVASIALFSYLAYRVYNQCRFVLMSRHQRAALISLFLLMGMSIVDFILLDIRVMVYAAVGAACVFYPLETKRS